MEDIELIIKTGTGPFGCPLLLTTGYSRHEPHEPRVWCYVKAGKYENLFLSIPGRSEEQLRQGVLETLPAIRRHSPDEF